MFICCILYYAKNAFFSYQYDSLFSVIIKRKYDICFASDLVKKNEFNFFQLLQMSKTLFIIDHFFRNINASAHFYIYDFVPIVNIIKGQPLLQCNVCHHIWPLVCDASMCMFRIICAAFIRSSTRLDSSELREVGFRAVKILLQRSSVYKSENCVLCELN